MNARGDMMPKAVNLTDMLLQRPDGQGQDRAQEVSRNKGAARTSRRKADFIPEQQAPRAQEARSKESRSAAPKTFHERVKESQARMSRKDHTFFKQPGNRVAQPGKPVEQPRSEEASRAQDAAAPQRTNSRPAGGQEKIPAAKESPQAKEAATSPWAPKESRPIDLGKIEGIEVVETGAGTGIDAAEEDQGMIDLDALQARLDELGIAASPEQLRDPAFLAEMLWMIDGIPMSMPLFEEAPAAEGEARIEGIAPAATAPADGEDPAGAGTTARATPAIPVGKTPEAMPVPAGLFLDGVSSTPAEAMDWTQVAEPEREEIAALIREKLGMLADKPGMRAPEAAGRAASPSLPETIKMARAGADAPLTVAAPAAAADLGLADPDRLRVLQGAGLAAQDRPVKTEMGFGFAIGQDIDEDGNDKDALLTGEAIQAEGGTANGKQGASSDLLGRNPSQNAAAEALGSREVHAAKDAPSANFQAAVDQARGQDARAAETRAPAPPQQSAPEPTVLAQIARKMSALANRGTEEIRIQLEPEHLGRVRISLEMQNGGMTARIAVENDAVRQIVDANLANLKESLESQGIKLNGMEVSVEQRHSSLFNPDGSNAREFFHRRGQGGGEGAPENSQDGNAESETGRRLGYNTMEYIA